ncbi:MAG: extracellular solute-binding protein, partial [Cellulosilyticaceae bacterium]
MKKFSKVLALGLAATMLGGAFVGCQPKEQPKPEAEKPADNGGDTAKQPEAEKPAGPVTLKTVSMFGGTDPHAEFYQKLQADFQAANSNVTIEDESATADPAWKSAVATDFAAGNEPDVIFYFTEAQAKPLVDGGKVVSIDEIRTVDPEYGKNIADSAY